MFQLSDLPFDIFKEVAEDSLNHFMEFVPNKPQKNCQHTLSSVEVNELMKLFKSIFTQLSYSILSTEDLSKMFDNDKANFILNCFNENKYFLATSLLKEHNAEIDAVLDNFDWKVKWIIGSSVSTSLRYPLLQLDLSTTMTHTSDKIATNVISCELNKEELDRLIFELESKNKTA